MLTEFGKFLLLALATSSISLTISRSHVFKSMRDFIAKHNAVLSKLLECPYCTSHWVAFTLVVVYKPNLIHVSFVLDWFVLSMAVVSVAAILMGIMFQSISSILHDEE